MSKGAATISILLAALIGFVIGNITNMSSRAPTVDGEAANGTASGPRQADADRIPIGTSPSLGPNNALVTIVEFSDFQCPFCSRVEDTLRQVRQHYGNDVRIVWKNNPLPFHDHATPAAQAAMAAHAQGKFWQMHDLLYQNQQHLERADLERYGQQIGLDMNRFRHDLDTNANTTAIEADKALATRLSAQGTPNFFINGTNLVGAQPVERFNAVIDSVLARARTITPRDRVYATMVADPVAAPDAPQRPNQPAQPQQPQQQLDPNTVYRVPVGNSPSRGPADALVTIVEFSDYQCPFCSRVEPTLEQVRQRYGNDVRIVWKNMPLEFHDKAMPAAEAAQEAFAQQGNDGFWRMHDTLYQHQHDATGLDRAQLEQYAQAQGLNMARFRAALDGHTHQAEIRADSTLAQQIAANGTPHFFINGRRLVGAQPIDRFTAAIDQAKTEAQNLVSQQHVARSAVYERLTGTGATAPVYQNNGAAAPGAAAAAPPAGNPEERVYNVPANPHAPYRGGQNARVVIEHFSDFQCPFCSRVNPSLDQVAQQYGDRVVIHWRNYPLSFHQNAMPAAEAAMEAFAQQGNAGFWRMHDTLFQNQQNLTRENLETYAQQQGLNMQRFRAALDGHTHQAEIQADQHAADAIGIADGFGTPASFINGHFVSGAQPVAAFQRWIDAALQGGGAAHPAAAAAH